MKIFLPLVLLLAASVPSFGLVTLNVTGQNFGLTGIGTNSIGQGQSKMTWGTCAFDGSTTTCSLTGTYTGLGSGGTYNLSVSYAGNGEFPLLAISTLTDPNRFTALATVNFDYVGTLTPTNGTPINFYSFGTFELDYNSSAVCTGVTLANCTVAQVGATPGATITGKVTGLFDTAPRINPGTVITAGAFGAFPAAAPGSWIEIYGLNLANVRSQTWATEDFNGNNGPTALAGTKVTIGGKATFIDYSSPGQVNVQLPSDTPIGAQQLIVTTAGGSSTAYILAINATEPGVLAPPSFVINGTQHIVALISGTFNYVLPVSVAGIVTVKAKPGDNITLYGVGFGAVTPTINAGVIVQQTNQTQSPVTVTIGGVPATVTYSGLAPGYLGLYQFNVVVPSVGAGDTQPVEFRLGGANVPQTFAIAIRN
ncbi:MAG: hypothetical protein WDO18_10130 [Acidobacteriota bacterium]